MWSRFTGLILTADPGRSSIVVSAGSARVLSSDFKRERGLRLGARPIACRALVAVAEGAAEAAERDETRAAAVRFARREEAQKALRLHAAPANNVAAARF